jgi:hypothetical protein
VDWNTDKLFYPLHVTTGSLGELTVTPNRRNVTVPPGKHLIVDLKHEINI